MRDMYNGIEELMTGETVYPSFEFEELTSCLNKIDPLLEVALERAWQGMETYWNTHGGVDIDNGLDEWSGCKKNVTRWHEVNCTSQPGNGMAIWEPCNYASNLAYNKLTQEICAQTWKMPSHFVEAMGRSFAMLTFGSAFFHASETRLGNINDNDDMFAYNLHQIGVAHLPYSPVLHDLAFTPRNMTGPAVVAAWRNIYLNDQVNNWYREQTTIYQNEVVSI